MKQNNGPVSHQSVLGDGDAAVLIEHVHECHHVALFFNAKRVISDKSVTKVHEGKRSTHCTTMNPLSSWVEVTFTQCKRAAKQRMRC